MDADPGQIGIEHGAACRPPGLRAFPLQHHAAYVVMLQGGHLRGERIKAPIAHKGGQALRLAGAVYILHDHGRPFGPPLRGAARAAAVQSCAVTRAGEEVVAVCASSHNDNWTMERKRSRSRSRSQNGETNGATTGNERENERERRGKKTPGKTPRRGPLRSVSVREPGAPPFFGSARPRTAGAFDSAASVFL